MPWVRFTDNYLANDKITPLSAYARLLDMAAIVYSARELRDGRLSIGDVETVAAAARVPRWQRSAAELMAANRWELAPGGYVIHDYLDYQPSREHVLAEREAARVRKKSGRNPGRSSPEPQPEAGQRSAEVQPESARSSNAPVPGTRSPEFPNGNPGDAPPYPPRKRRGPARANSSSIEFETDGPRYEQRLGADGKREWVEVEV